jgi:hypothetical protein
MWANCRTHLAEAGESYFEHLCFAAGVGLMLVAAGLACILHALIPACCTTTASRTVRELTRLFAERDALPQVLDQASGALVLVALLGLALPSLMLLLMVPGDSPMPFALAPLSLAFPAAYLWTNPQLEPVR